MPILNVKAAALLVAAAACIAVISAPSAIAGPWEDAAAAYERGETAEAVRLLRPLADGGDAEAQALLGLEYTLGQGVPQDLTQAMIWYRRAAEQGYAAAQAALGVMYANGRGVPHDRAEALRWLRPAAAAGDVTARTELARVEAAEEALEARDLQSSGQSQPSPAAAEASTVASRAPAPEAGEPASSSAPPAADPTASAAGMPGTADASASPAAPAADPSRLAAAAAGRTAVPEAAAPRRDLNLLAALVRRGDAMLAASDVSAARLYYERAATGGSAAGATGAGKTHDPAFLSRLDGFGIRSDPSAAATWYRKAVALGDPEAERLLRRLGAAVAD